jgi:hypothetical protein
MDIQLEEEPRLAATRDYQLALSALNRLPDRCAVDVGELAERIGADKLELITWVRADIKFARLIASKVSQ